MSAVGNLTDSFNRINFSSPHQAWLSENQRSNRNLQCMPSDDEDDDNDDDVYSSDSDQESLYKKPHKTTTKVKSNIPLPSDEEDNTDDDVEEEDDDEDDDVLLPISYNNAMKRPTHGALPFRNNRSAPTLPQQFEQQQPYMQHSDGSTGTNSLPRVIEGNNRSISTDNLSRLIKEDDEDDEVIGQHLRHIDATPMIHHMHQYHQYQQQQHQQKHQQQQHQQHLAQFQYLHQQQQQKQQHVPMRSNRNQKQQHLRMTTMSGMDLLIQREQEKAEAKRQKPKLNPGKVKIEGLLGKLPEPGTHNINFQQIQQQYMNATPVPTSSTTKKHSKQHQQPQQQVYGYHNSNNIMPSVPQQQQVSFGYIPTPPSVLDYYSNGRSSVPPMNNNIMYGQQLSFYQIPAYVSNHSLYMMTNQSQPAQPQQLQSISRPGSAMNSSKQRSTTPISFSQQ